MHLDLHLRFLFFNERGQLYCLDFVPTFNCSCTWAATHIPHIWKIEAYDIFILGRLSIQVQLQITFQFHILTNVTILEILHYFITKTFISTVKSILNSKFLQNPQMCCGFRCRHIQSQNTSCLIQVTLIMGSWITLISQILFDQLFSYLSRLPIIQITDIKEHQN